MSREDKPSNRAAWLTTKSSKILEVKTAPYTQPRENEIVVKNSAVAINPVDWVKEHLGSLIFSFIKYPFIVGTDLAGTVVEVGPAVTRFQPGDRVLGHAVGMDPLRNNAAESAFQEYTVLRTNMAAAIPASLSFESACVLPLGLSTAACCLFQKDFLALEYPTVPATPTGKTLVVWGGSTSVGSNAIQLGVAAGYEVFTTASPRNFEYVKRLGAARVFDYRSRTVLADMLAALKGKECAGAIAVGTGSSEFCLDVVGKSKGKKFVALTTIAMPEKVPPTFGRFMGTVPQILWSTISIFLKSTMYGVGTKFVFGSSLMENEVSKVVYEDYLPIALAEGKYIAAPEPQVVGKGLEYIQEAFDLQMKGVSAKKVVVSL